MPLLLDTGSRTQTLTCAINDILSEFGPAGLTMRRIAAVSGVNTSSIRHQMGDREHLLRVAAGRTGRARIAALRTESRSDGVLAFLPRSDDEVLDTRAWLAWLELWRVEEFLSRSIGESRADERGLLAQVTDYRLLRHELDELLALIDGLRTAICAPTRPIRLETAREILSNRCHTLTGTRVSPPQTQSRRTA